MSWLQEADCADYPNPDTWFPDPEHDTPEQITAKEKAAKAVCLGCPVAADCLELGMRKENRRWGIFGGLTAKERKDLYRATNSG